MKKKTKKILLKGGANFQYKFPMNHDRIFRSSKYGQNKIRNMAGITRIMVSDRANAYKAEGISYVNVNITADTKENADKAFNYAESLIPSVPEKEENKFSNSNSSVTKEVIIKKLEELIEDIKKL